MPVAAVGRPAHHTQRCTGVLQHRGELPTVICSSKNERKVLLAFLLEPPAQVFYSSSRRCPQSANYSSCFHTLPPSIHLTPPCSYSRAFSSSPLSTKSSSESSIDTSMLSFLFLPDSCHISSRFHSFNKCLLSTFSVVG